MRMMPLPGGGVRRTVEGRETFYTCDLVPGRGDGMRQTSLTFTDATVDVRGGADDNTSGNNFNNDFDDNDGRGAAL